MAWLDRQVRHSSINTWRGLRRWGCGTRPNHRARAYSELASDVPDGYAFTAQSPYFILPKHPRGPANRFAGPRPNSLGMLNAVADSLPDDLGFKLRDRRKHVE
jgi:hypothetical protein